MTTIEIDLDIDQLDTKTQRKLQEFVMQVRFDNVPDTLCVFLFNNKNACI